MLHMYMYITSRLNIPGEDVARQFVLDLGVFLVSLVTLVIDIFVVVKLRPPKPAAAAGSGDGQGGANGTTTGDDDKEGTEIEAHHVDSESGIYCKDACIAIYWICMFTCVYTCTSSMLYEYGCTCVCT